VLLYSFFLVTRKGLEWLHYEQGMEGNHCLANKIIIMLNEEKLVLPLLRKKTWLLFCCLATAMQKNFLLYQPNSYPCMSSPQICLSPNTTKLVSLN